MVLKKSHIKGKELHLVKVINHNGQDKLYLLVNKLIHEYQSKNGTMTQISKVKVNTHLPIKLEDGLFYFSDGYAFYLVHKEKQWSTLKVNTKSNRVSECEIFDKNQTVHYRFICLVNKKIKIMDVNRKGESQFMGMN